MGTETWEFIYRLIKLFQFLWFLMRLTRFSMRFLRSKSISFWIFQLVKRLFVLTGLQWYNLLPQIFIQFSLVSFVSKFHRINFSQNQEFTIFEPVLEPQRLQGWLLKLKWSSLAVLEHFLLNFKHFVQLQMIPCEINRLQNAVLTKRDFPKNSINFFYKFKQNWA